MFIIFLSSQFAHSQFWTIVDNGITDIAHNEAPFAMCSDSTNLYVAFPEKFSYDSINRTYTCKVGITQWNGTFWSKLPSLYIYNNGPNVGEMPEIKSMIVYKDELYIAGTFQRSDLNESTMIVKFDGQNWLSLSHPVIGPIDTIFKSTANSLSIYDDKLFIAGKFTLRSAPQTNLLIWDGDSLKADDSLRFNDEIHDMEVVNNELYIAGAFTEVNGYSAENIVKWNGIRNTQLTSINKNIDYISTLGKLNNNIYVAVKAYDSIDYGIFYYKTNNWHKITINDPYFVTDMLEYNNQLWIAGVEYISSNHKNWIWNDTSLALDTNNQFSSFRLNEFKSNLYSLHLDKTFNSIPYNHISRYEDQASLISGQVYYDIDRDCIKDTQEIGVSDAYLILDGTTILKPKENGLFELPLSAGIYILDFDKTVNYYKYYYLETLNCSTTPPYTINVNQPAAHNNYNFPLFPITNIKDLNVNISAYRGYRARQGFTDDYIVNVSNPGTSNASPVYLTLYYDTEVSFISSNIAPDSHVNNKLWWNLPPLDPQNNHRIKIKFKTEMNTNLNDTVNFFAWTWPMMGDSNKTDNYDTLTQYVSAAIDPNDKQSYPSDYITKSTKKINYIINFQNNGNDTAYRVIVIDTIDISKYKINKIYMNSTSHPSDFRISGNVFIWTFDNILLPDSTTDEEASKGFISYTAYINPNLNIGDSIMNKADIYFDYQKPITTNYATVEIIDPSVSIPGSINRSSINIYPNPTENILIFESGQEMIKRIEIYDLKAKLIYKSENIDQLKYTMDIQDINIGLYILKVHKNSGIEYLRVIIL